MTIRHFTNKKGWKSIRSQVDWTFRASAPPPAHNPFGAYFTTLAHDAPKLAARLGIPKSKLECLFEFADAGDLEPIQGGRGAYIVYSRADYVVRRDRQLWEGETRGR